MMMRSGHVGVVIEADRIRAATVRDATAEPEGVVVGASPPVAFVDAVDLRRVVVDGWDPSVDVRESGFGGEGEESRQVARRSLSSAWAAVTGRPADTELARARWREQFAMYPESALSQCVQDIFKSQRCGEDGGRLALVIPNELHELRQDQLLTELGGIREEVRLVWRPVAAALCWRQWASSHLEKQQYVENECLGAILCVHCGIEQIEATRLNMVCYGGGRRSEIVPARDAASREAVSLRGVLDDLPSTLARASLQAAGVKADDFAVSRLLYCTPWLSSVLAEGEARAAQGGVAREILLRLAFEGRTPRFPSSQDLATVTSEALDRDERFAKWITRTRQACAASSFNWVGAVVTGPLSAVRWGRTTLGRRIAEAVLGLTPPLLLTEAEYGRGPSILARGAARLAALSAEGRATYLDTLPSLELLVTERGEPIWKSVLNNPREPDGAPRYVEGDKEWEPAEPLEGFGIRDKEKTLRIELVMEGFDTVRASAVDLPTATTAREPVTLRVKMKPASGMAHVRVVPRNPSLRTGRPLQFNFLAMQDTMIAPEERLNQEVLVCPRLEPRVASWERWSEFLAAAPRILDRLGRRSSRVDAFSDAKELLIKKDNSRVLCLGATAVGSDGDPPTRGQRDGECLRVLIGEALASVRSAGESPEGEVALRVLGYCSASEPELLDHLAKRLRGSEELKEAEIIAIGNCLREPEMVASAVERLTKELIGGAAKEDRYRALAQMMRYRTDALRDVKEPLCVSLADHLRGFMDGECKRGVQKYKATRQRPCLARNFREASRIVLFLLRKRIYSDGFLDPAGSAGNERSVRLAAAIKNVFSAVADAVSARQMDLMTGAVDQVAVLRQLRDYIDKRGRGVVVLD